jgi:hypothetical protein
MLLQINERYGIESQRRQESAWMHKKGMNAGKRDTEKRQKIKSN